MAADSDLIRLYSGRILALAAEIPHGTRLAQAQGSAKRRSPLCGSTVTADVVVKDGRIAEFGQDVKACALGQASAAVLGQVAIGRSADEIARARAQLVAMLGGAAETPEAPFDGLAVLAPAAEYRNRHASILLPFDATLEAMAAASA